MRCGRCQQIAMTAVADQLDSRNKNNELPRQNYVCRDKCFVAAKNMFVMTNDVFCHDKHVLVATNTCLSWQNICRDKYLWQLLPMILYWHNQLWQSLEEECWKARLGLWLCDCNQISKSLRLERFISHSQSLLLIQNPAIFNRKHGLLLR